MTIDFISDLHLDKTRPEVNEYFINYLDNINSDVTDLYILGDLFEYWVGDDDPMDGLDKVRNSIKILGDKINVWYMHGNRDFLVSKKICNNLKMQPLNDPTIVVKHEVKLLLLHGDTLCTDDVEYQKFRSLVRSDKWQKQMLSKTLEERLMIAGSLREKSKDANASKDLEIMDVNLNQVDKLIANHEPEVVIHGHTHRPNVHNHALNGINVSRYVLGDWYNRFFILSLKNKRFSILKGKLK
jgi:UDP-2,3-diacylglucosamine hydrolase